VVTVRQGESARFGDAAPEATPKLRWVTEAAMSSTLDAHDDLAARVDTLT
jgi:hypothetical protein